MSDVAMWRKGLAAPAPVWPADCVIRAYRPGDAAAWLALHRAAGIYGAVPDSLFQREFGIDDDAALPQRQYYVWAGEQPVATGTAWLGQPTVPAGWGRLHWIAVHPDWRRRQVATNLVFHLLHTFARLGYNDAYLTTGADNYPAIRLYLTIGFQPLERAAADAERWAAIQAKLAAGS